MKHRMICPRWKCYTNLVSPYGTGTHVSSLDKFFDNMYFAKKSFGIGMIENQAKIIAQCFLCWNKIWSNFCVCNSWSLCAIWLFTLYPLDLGPKYLHLSTDTNCNIQFFIVVLIFYTLNFLFPILLWAHTCISRLNQQLIWNKFHLRRKGDVRLFGGRSRSGSSRGISSIFLCRQTNLQFKSLTENSFFIPHTLLLSKRKCWYCHSNQHFCPM